MRSDATEDTGTGTPVDPPERSRRRRRGVLLGALTLIVLAVLTTGIVLIGTIGIAGPLRDGRAALEDGRRALLNGRPADAVAAFDEARTAFRTAGERGEGLPAKVGGAVPYLGRSVDVAVALGAAGERLAEAGRTVAAAIDDLPGGFDSLAPRDGAIPLEALLAVGPALADAEDDLAAATATLRGSPTGFLPDPVREARTQALTAAHELEHSFRSARAFAEALPGFAGADGVRRYLFFAEDPAELRGTGGIWGAYSIVTAQAGRFRFSPFRPVQTIGEPPAGSVPSPNPDYERNYGQYGAPTYWLNANMTPDLPSAAQATLATWSALGRVPVDGVIAADPFALRELLVVTGAVAVPEPPIRLTTDNVVPLLTNEAFARFTDPRVRKAVLGEAAGVVVDRFLSLDGRVAPRLRALAGAFSEGHLKLYTNDPAMERALAIAGLQRALDANGGDLLAVIANSGSGGKVNYFTRRTIRHDTQLFADGTSAATTVVTIVNDTPRTGQPRYVIGPHRRGAEAGDDIPLLAVFRDGTCQLRSAERNGDDVEVRTGTELGYRFFRDYFTIGSGEEGSLELRTTSENVWEADPAGGTYRLTVIGQTTIRPTRATITLRAPEGMRFVRGSGTDGLEVDGAVASWHGPLPDRLDLSVSIERVPLGIRLWRALTGAL